MKTADVRAAFLAYFEKRAHRVVSSDSLIPSTDPTLLFTSAGMVQFKPNFENPDKSPFKRAASCQKCLRTSDIDRVGHTLRHLTFFEMLGNFSFGDYFKKDAIEWGWEFLTVTIGLPKDRFYASVHNSDDEAFNLWKSYLPEDRIIKLGDDTNFWTMGPTGPCGPCSEILWDRGPEWGCGKPGCGVGCDCDRYLEVWNLVFTQFNRGADGKLTPLPRKNIDTGMGLERLSLLVQGVASPFGTDAFQTIFRALGKIIDREIPREKNEPGEAAPDKAAFRRIADHSRAITFMICDGILPSNEGRGYVLRRLLRQAVRAGKTLGVQEPFVYKLTGAVVDDIQEAYPEVRQRRETIATVVKMEEEKFLETLDTGTRQLEQLVEGAKKRGQTTLPGKEIFQLYDTFGFPFELTREMTEGMGFTVDEDGFKKAQAQAVELARQAWKGSGAQDVGRYRDWKSKVGVSSVFRGYDSLTVQTKIARPMFLKEGDKWVETSSLKAGQEGELALSETPFYAEGGGQVGDQGVLESAHGKARILDTRAPVEGLTVNRVQILSGVLSADDSVKAEVDAESRASTMRHHTATHLLHKALRQVLGLHVTQSGSLVAPDRLRFDFTHYAALSQEERQRVEDLVNEQILKNVSVHVHQVSIKEAQKAGAMALFGEKYGDQVRAVMVSDEDWQRAPEAWSLELCGGTHVNATGQIGFFKILSETAISAGVRRIEAVAGKAAVQAVRRMEYQLSTAAEVLHTTPAEIQTRIDRILQQEKDLEKEIRSLKSSALRSKFDDIAKSSQTVGCIRFISQRMDGIDDKQLREIADRLRDSGNLDLVVIASVKEEKVSFVISVSKTAVERGLNAGSLARELASLLQGSGGGRPDFAQGGGKNLAALENALGQVGNFVKKLTVKSSK
jgi:alanyl-tRNA synthetase